MSIDRYYAYEIEQVVLVHDSYKTGISGISWYSNYFIWFKMEGKFIFFLDCFDAHCMWWITACALFSFTYYWSYQNWWPIIYYIWRHRACLTKTADKSFFCKPMQFVLGHVLLKLVTNLFFCKLCNSSSGMSY